VSPPGSTHAPFFPNSEYGRRSTAWDDAPRTLVPGRTGGELDEPLRHVPPRLSLDLRAERIPLGRARLGPDEHPVATGFVDGLDHHLRQVLEDVAPIVVAEADPGLDLLEQWLLREVEADHLRNVRVDRFVVGDAVSRRVGERDVPFRPGAHDSWNAQHAVLAEHFGIENASSVRR